MSDVVVCMPLSHRQMIVWPTATLSVAGVNWKSATLTLQVAAKLADIVLIKTAATRSNFFIAHFSTQTMDDCQEYFQLTTCDRVTRLLLSRQRVCPIARRDGSGVERHY